MIASHLTDTTDANGGLVIALCLLCSLIIYSRVLHPKHRWLSAKLENLYMHGFSITILIVFQAGNTLIDTRNIYQNSCKQGVLSTFILMYQEGNIYD